jgi:hypothetical protein
MTAITLVSEVFRLIKFCPRFFNHNRAYFPPPILEFLGFPT